MSYVFVSFFHYFILLPLILLLIVLWNAFGMLQSLSSMSHMNINYCHQGGGSYFPYILLNEIKTMFSQLAKQSLRKLSADTSTAHEQYDADSNA